MRWLVMATLTLVLACERYDEPNRPLPPLQLEHVDGRALDLSSLRGRPVVINLWLPG
ncbi:MAG: hypothetical protein AB2A00_04810 [Myxococcota bacterium]